MPTWVDDAIWWHVYPLGFTGAPIRPAAREPVTHRLGRLEAWLDHVVALGCNGLLLGPIFDSLSHGYDTTDHFTIDPRLGDDDDFDALVAAAHRRGIRIVLDGVFNHVGRSFPQFIAAESGNGEAAQWFARTDSTWADFEGHGELVALNHDNPIVASYIQRVLEYWLDRGIDGWRLDATYSIPASFWGQLLPGARQRFPEAWFLGEMIHGDYGAYATEATLDSITQYELWKAIWSSLKDGNFFELGYALGRHNDFCRSLRPQTFIGNHDVTRIASAIGDHRDLALAEAVLFTVPGIPSIYAGDEFGLEAVKEDRLGGDDAVRPKFPADPAEMAGDRQVLRDYQRLIGLRRRHRWLTRGEVTIHYLGNRILGYSVSSNSERIVALLNASDEKIDPAQLPPGPVKADPLPLAGLRRELETTETLVAPHSFAIFTPPASPSQRSLTL